MCFDIMATEIDNGGLKTICQRKSCDSSSKWRLRKMLHFSSTEEASKQWRTAVVKATLRKYIRHEQKRRQLAKLVKEEFKGLMNKNPRGLVKYSHANQNVANTQQARGAMAPKNTTQYLMDIAYDDMLRDNSYQCSLRPDFEFAACYQSSSNNACSDLDSTYEKCVAFQQRDFEEVYSSHASCWSGLNRSAWLRVVRKRAHLSYWLSIRFETKDRMQRCAWWGLFVHKM